jgi:1-acyl-sn-glycerol-3-phosphate acyltransferase
VSLLASVLAWVSGASVFALIAGLIFAGTAVGSRAGYDPAAKALCRRLMRCFRMRVRVEGLERLQRGRPYIFLANHVNILDGFLLYGHLPWPFRGLELASHFRWPVYGPFARVFGNIPVDPRDGALSARGLARARRVLGRGVSILVLPEGHRTRSGSLGAFGRGAFRLALASGVELVPVVMAGAFDVLRTGSWRVTPGPVRVRVGEPLPVSGGAASGPDALRSLARERMLALLATPPRRPLP